MTTPKEIVVKTKHDYWTIGQIHQVLHCRGAEIQTKQILLSSGPSSTSVHCCNNLTVRYIRF
ncbi:hypothetical protein Mapa_015313 [Marchantia paleacea]|nr:hypothetical protein Mapa_015313 [Marchantia paleacea]